MAAKKRLGDGNTEEDKKYKIGKRKILRLSKEIERMWHELENTYNNNRVTKAENDLEAEKLHLKELYEDTQGQAKVRKHQSAALDENEEFDSKIKSKNSNVQT